jgi:hypothetical protein
LYRWLSSGQQWKPPLRHAASPLGVSGGHLGGIIFFFFSSAGLSVSQKNERKFDLHFDNLLKKLVKFWFCFL